MISAQLFFLVLLLVACMLAVHAHSRADGNVEGGLGQFILSSHGSDNHGPHGK
ncbi:Protein CBG26989 [Caenorhabditis briggsae]|uniref:Protein CBG26989 n=1 Tax=Caenorhabditis briggsae TaxID=6238 RepID=B6IEV5_CAEBR|nr:Protein CBG26989 [Caenorhabditis briggsae]CAR98435.1 Protein CBG26989 [Caenorhabditis briggsae]